MKIESACLSVTMFALVLAIDPLHADSGPTPRAAAGAKGAAGVAGTPPAAARPGPAYGSGTSGSSGTFATSGASGPEADPRDPSDFKYGEYHRSSKMTPRGSEGPTRWGSERDDVGPPAAPGATSGSSAGAAGSSAASGSAHERDKDRAARYDKDQPDKNQQHRSQPRQQP